MQLTAYDEFQGRRIRRASQGQLLQRRGWDGAVAGVVKAITSRPECWALHLRMTEKRRLAMAAAAMKPRITTLNRVLEFLSPTAETMSRGRADIVVGSVGNSLDSWDVEVIHSLRVLPR